MAICQVGLHAAETIALMFDLNLGPGPDGSVVGHYLAQHYADVPIIIVTGRPDLFPQERLRDRGWSLIRKPYLPSELVKHLHDRLA